MIFMEHFYTKFMATVHHSSLRHFNDECIVCGRGKGVGRLWIEWGSVLGV